MTVARCIVINDKKGIFRMASSFVDLSANIGLCVKGALTVPAHKNRRLAIDTYLASRPLPDFALRFFPAHLEDEIGISIELVKTADATHYMLFYRFCNFTDEVCRIVILQKTYKLSSPIGRGERI